MTLRVYSTDLTFYDGYMDKLVQEATAGFSHAISRLQASVPRLANMDAVAIAAADLTIDDARSVYACEHGFDAWEAFTSHLAKVGSSDVQDPFPAFIQAVERGDLVEVDSILDEDPDLVQHVASTGKSALQRCQCRHGNTNDRPRCPGRTREPCGRRHCADACPRVGQHRGCRRSVRREPGPGQPAGCCRARAPGSAGEDVGRRRGAHTAGSRQPQLLPTELWLVCLEPSDNDQEVLDEALVYAATNGRIEAAQYLVDRGADVDGFAY